MIVTKLRSFRENLQFSLDMKEICIVQFTLHVFLSVNSSQKNFSNHSQVKYLVIKYMTTISWWIIPCFQCNRKNNKGKTLICRLCIIQNMVAYEVWVCSVTQSSADLSWFYSYLKWREYGSTLLMHSKVLRHKERFP